MDGTGASQDEFRYTYDVNSNPLGKLNVLAPDHSEAYTYDALNRLQTFERVSVSFSGGTVTTHGTASRTQDWTLDSLGNWNSLDTDGTSVSRDHNAQNQLVGIGSNSLTFDDAGNQTADEDGNTLVYDAWNRLVSWSDGTTTVTYIYDALGRRVLRNDGATASTYTYSTQWQVLVEADGAKTYAYVWSPAYVDGMVARDEFHFSPPIAGDYNGDGHVDAADYTVWADNFGRTGVGIPGDGNADGVVDTADYTLWADHFGQSTTAYQDGRVYPRQDANWNVTSLVVGTVVSSAVTWATAERYEQDPYGGNLVVMDDGFTQTGSGFGGSGVGWEHFHQGGQADAVTGLVSFRFREYDPEQGRWLGQDPLGYPDGLNRYEADQSEPAATLDPTGAKSIGWIPGKGYPVYKKRSRGCLER